MKITVFGASGGIGAHAHAEILIGPDIFDPGFAAVAIRGADVVITAAGPNFATRRNPRTAMTSPPDLHQRLARTLIAATKDRAVPPRLIAVSTASMGPADEVMGAGPRLLFRFFRTVVAPNLGRVGKDLRAMEEELATSGLDWYALRPVKLTDGSLTRNVQASDRFTMKTISRADAAWHILNLAEDPAPGRSRTPVITTSADRKPRPAETRIQISPPGKRPPVSSAKSAGPTRRFAADPPDLGTHPALSRADLRCSS